MNEWSRILNFWKKLLLSKNNASFGVPDKKKNIKRKTFLWFVTKDIFSRSIAFKGLYTYYVYNCSFICDNLWSVLMSQELKGMGRWERSRCLPVTWQKTKGLPNLTLVSKKVTSTHYMKRNVCSIYYVTL